MPKDIKKEIKDLTNKLLKKIGFAQAKVSVTQKDDLLKINIEAEESGALIGYHGETINALQLLLGLFIYNRQDKWIKILVDIGDYRAKRAEQLKELGSKAAQRAKFSGRPVSLSGLSSFERRIVHLALQDDPQVETHSEGEGKNRMLVIAPKIQEEKKQIEKQ